MKQKVGGKTLPLAKGHGGKAITPLLGQTGDDKTVHVAAEMDAHLGCVAEQLPCRRIALDAPAVPPRWGGATQARPVGVEDGVGACDPLPEQSCAGGAR